MPKQVAVHELAKKITASWAQYETLLKRSGELRRESEKLQRDSMAKLLDTSRLLCEAFENQERYGDWGRLWKDKKHSPPFSKSKADRLRAIWTNTALRDSANWRKLPTARISLIEDLATMPADQLQSGIDDGIVQPKMTAPQVTALREGTPQKTIPIEAVVRRALKGLHRQLAKGYATELPTAKKLVREIVEELFSETADTAVAA